MNPTKAMKPLKHFPGVVLLTCALLAGLCLTAPAAQKKTKAGNAKAARSGKITPSKPVITGTPEGQILTAGSRRAMILSPEGKILWERPTGLTHDTWMLPSGNILYADEATVTEVTPGQQVVWQYKAENQKGGGTFACQRLENGNTLVGENSTGRVLEVDKSGKVVFTLQTSPCKIGDHQNMRMARKLKNGNYLVCQSGAGLVKEYKPDGTVAQELKVGSVAFSAVRTPQGTTLVGNINRIVEFDKDGKVIWEFKNTDIPFVTIGSITGIHLLPNGHIAVGCYRAYDKEGKGVGLFEITRDKNLVWSYANPHSPDGTMMPIEMMTPDGKALPGEALR